MRGKNESVRSERKNASSKGKTPPPSMGKSKIAPPSSFRTESTKPPPGSNSGTSLLLPKMPVRESESEIMAQEYEKVTPMALFKTNTWINDGTSMPIGRRWWGQKKKKQKNIVLIQMIVVFGLVATVILLLIILGAVYLRKERMTTRDPRLTTKTLLCREQYSKLPKDCLTEADDDDGCDINGTLCHMKRWTFKIDRDSTEGIIAHFEKEEQMLPLAKTEFAECTSSDANKGELSWCRPDEKGVGECIGDHGVKEKRWYPNPRLDQGTMKPAIIDDEEDGRLDEMPCLDLDKTDAEKRTKQALNDLVSHFIGECGKGKCAHCNTTICFDRNSEQTINVQKRYALQSVRYGLRAELYHCDLTSDDELGTRKSMCTEEVPIKVFACHHCKYYVPTLDPKDDFAIGTCHVNVDDDRAAVPEVDDCWYQCKNRNVKGPLPNGFACTYKQKKDESKEESAENVIKKDGVCLMGTCYEINDSEKFQDSTNGSQEVTKKAK